MDKQEAIKEALEKRKEKKQEEFKFEVEHLVWEIEDISNRLREKKRELADLQYQDPEILSDILEKQEEKQEEK